MRQTWCSTRTVQPVKLSLIIYPFSPPLLHHSNTVSTAVVHMNTFFSTFNPLLRRAPALPLPRSLVLAAISVRGRPYRLCSLLPPCVLFFGAIAGNRCKSIVYAFFFLNSRSCFNPIPPSTAFQPDPHLICLRKRERERGQLAGCSAQVLEACISSLYAAAMVRISTHLWATAVRLKCAILAPRSVKLSIA